MFKKSMVMLLLCALIAGCCPLMTIEAKENYQKEVNQEKGKIKIEDEDEEAEVELDCLVPCKAVYAFNYCLDFWANKFFEDDEDMVEQVVNQLSLHYTEVLGQNIYYNNDDWSMEMSALFEDTEPADDAQAHSITFVFSSKYEEPFLSLFEGALALSILQLDQSLELTELQRLMDLIYEGWTKGLTIDSQDGYKLSAFPMEEHYYFGIVHSDTNEEENS